MKLPPAGTQERWWYILTERLVDEVEPDDVDADDEYPIYYRHDEDPGSGQVVASTIQRYLIVQRTDDNDARFLIGCDTLEEAALEVADRLDEAFWFVDAVYDLETGQKLEYHVTVEFS